MKSSYWIIGSVGDNVGPYIWIRLSHDISVVVVNYFNKDRNLDKREVCYYIDRDYKNGNNQREKKKFFLTLTFLYFIQISHPTSLDGVECRYEIRECLYTYITTYN